VGTKVVVGLYKPAGKNNYAVTLSPNNGNLVITPEPTQTITWAMAGTTGNITAPANATLSAVSISNGFIGNGGRTGIPWPGGRPNSANGWKASDTKQLLNEMPTTTYGYAVTVNSAGTPIKSADPEIVNQPPVAVTIGPDPDIVNSPPGR
jgi:hypothetical protein